MKADVLGFLFPVAVLALPLAYAVDHGRAEAKRQQLAEANHRSDEECERALANNVITVRYGSTPEQNSTRELESEVHTFCRT